MELVRFAHPKHFSPEDGKYKDLAFANSRKHGGISVVDRGCAVAASADLCAHLVRYYEERVAGNPPVFFIFDENELPSDYKLEQQTTISGDVCHYNIHGISANRAEKWFKRRPRGPESFWICNGDGTYRRPTAEELTELRNKFLSSL